MTTDRSDTIEAVAMVLATDADPSGLIELAKGRSQEIFRQLAEDQGREDEQKAAAIAHLGSIEIAVTMPRRPTEREMAIMRRIGGSENGRVRFKALSVEFPGISSVSGGEAWSFLRDAGIILESLYDGEVQLTTIGRSVLKALDHVIPPAAQGL